MVSAKESLMRKLVLMILLFVVVSHRAAGQETTGAISGRVVDGQGLPVPGATVTIAGVQGSKRITTDADGRFAVQFLTPGSYEVRVELQGFRTAARKDIAVSLGKTTSVPVTMEVGAIS